MLEPIILGTIQGIAEWLPISSSGMITLVMSNFFEVTDISVLLQRALFLHLGTLLAALVYFRKEVLVLIKALFNYRKTDAETKNVLNFLIISTIIAGIVGITIGLFLFNLNLELTGKTITLVIGILLLITAGLQLSPRRKGPRNEKDLKISDSILLGIAQGTAVIPGISRSGITISTMLLRKIDDTLALKLSFLMSIPIVLFGNIFLNLPDISSTFTYRSLVGLLLSFALGMLTIHLLIKLTKKINFGYFVLIFAILTILAVLV